MCHRWLVLKVAACSGSQCSIGVSGCAGRCVLISVVWPVGGVALHVWSRFAQEAAEKVPDFSCVQVAP